MCRSFFSKRDILIGYRRASLCAACFLAELHIPCKHLVHLPLLSILLIRTLRLCSAIIRDQAQNANQLLRISIKAVLFLLVLLDTQPARRIIARNNRA